MQKCIKNYLEDEDYMANELSYFNNILILRNHLSSCTEKEMMNLYQEKDFYEAFLNTVWALMENDSGFLLLNDEFIQKILSVIQIHRFDSSQEIKKQINEIIQVMNQIKNYSDSLRNIIKNNYLAYQEEQREVTFQTEESLIASLAYDAITYNMLTNGIQSKRLHDDYFIMSLNYFIKTAPEMFQEEEVKERALEVLERINKETRQISFKKRFIKNARKNLKELSTKEE